MCLFVWFIGCTVQYKPQAPCCFGEMSVPASVPSSWKGELGHRRDLSGAANAGQFRQIASRSLFFLLIILLVLLFLLFQWIFVPSELLLPALLQVLLQLCRKPGNVERLVETQELQCLIIGLTSLWDQTSATWRHQASRVLKAVSAAATSNTVPSLQGEGTYSCVFFGQLSCASYLCRQIILFQ